MFSKSKPKPAPSEKHSIALLVKHDLSSAINVLLSDRENLKRNETPLSSLETALFNLDTLIDLMDSKQ